MIKENEHWCCECYHYRGDTSIGEICDLTGESIYDCRPHNSHSCDKWEECISGPLNCEDIKLITKIHYEIVFKDTTGIKVGDVASEVLKRFKEAKQ